MVFVGEFMDGHVVLDTNRCEHEPPVEDDNTVPVLSIAVGKTSYSNFENI